ncbi:MAG: serine/threonine-protein kinase, partial [Planctomycetota bacterium]
MDRLGPYEIIEEVGRGGMGVVYKARRPDRPGTFAIKVLLAAQAKVGQTSERFKAEAVATARLDHPGIVKVLDSGDQDGFSYLVMKFVEGDVLDDLLEAGDKPVEEIAEIVQEVARAAHHAHERGVIHRDLKPSNVIIERGTGRPHVMDFGLAKDLSSDLALSQAGAIIGTPYYMPPEQAKARHAEIDARSDVYSLGAILYEALAGRPPHRAGSHPELIAKILTEEPTPPSELRPGVSKPLEAIVLKALAKKKENRYATAAALADDIERVLSGEAVEAGATSRSLPRGLLLVLVLAALGVVVPVALLVGRGVVDKRRAAAAKLAEETLE